MDTQDSTRLPLSQTSKRVAAPSDGNLSKKRKLGFGEYADSPILSDVTICYGDAGELTFEAHKVILCAHSHWFKAAFTGGFKESEAKTIRLIGDNPASVNAMLTWVYKQQSLLSTTEEFSIPNMIYCVELFRVADKYDLPTLCSNIQISFRVQLHIWLCRTHVESEDPALEEKNVEMFCDLVERVYTLPNTKPSHPLVMLLLDSTTHTPALKIFQNDGEAPSMLIKAAEDVSEFGRDIFLYLMEKTKSEVNTETGAKSVTELGMLSQVRCPECGAILRLDSESFYSGGYCFSCSHYVEDWSECEELEPMSPGSSVQGS
ncbi:hypothetical protein HBI34_106750 [Parastagonospora nodorum]|nr:hypothetical protein HBI34_106750 [Parastagonospora nodorum]